MVCAAAAGPALVSVGAQRAREQRILDARAKTNWGPMRLTWLTGRHRSTCWKVLHRHGVSCRRRTERPQTTRRYEWAEAGALLHIDAFELPKFEVPGHWAHGDRAERHRTRRAGKVKVIGVIDDHTRLAYCELHAAENAATVFTPIATLPTFAAFLFRDRANVFKVAAIVLLLDSATHLVVSRRDS